MQVGMSAVVRTSQDAAFVRDAERLGVTSAWVAETWAQDALTPLAYLAGQTTSIQLGSAIVQLGARSPANLAMSAMSLQLLSGGRFRLGIGVSGPAVMEGWHGVRFTSPLTATRETIEIIRAVTRGDRLQHDGRIYQLPPRAAVTTGAGRCPHLRRGARPAQPGADRRTGGRVDRQYVHPRAGAGVHGPAGRWRGPGWPSAR